MAEQESFIKLKGKVGDISFRKSSKDKTHMARLNAQFLKALLDDVLMPEGERLFTEPVFYI